MGWNPPAPPQRLHNGEFVVASGVPPFRMPGAPAPLWRCMCDGCGAPLQRADLHCSYCQRATMSAQPYGAKTGTPVTPGTHPNPARDSHTKHG